MKKTKKAIALLLSALLTFGAVGSLVACNGDDIKVDEKTIVVKARRAGFGTDWLYELKGKFEAAYAEEGYKVKIRTPDNAIKGPTLIQELALGYDETMVDLYITSDATPDQVGASGDYGILVENIEESVYSKPAISYDGTEETKTVREKISNEAVSYMTDTNGELYGYTWAQTSAGLVANTRKLAAYGLELPKTTNEMFDCFDKIYCGYNGIENSIESGTYPITYVSGQSGYGVVFLYALMAQYDMDEYNKFWTFMTTDETGASVKLSDENCQELFDDPMLLEMMKVAYRTFDLNIAAPGSASQGVDQAQAKIMGDVDGAVFMLNGDWMLNEFFYDVVDVFRDGVDVAVIIACKLLDAFDYFGNYQESKSTQYKYNEQEGANKSQSSFDAELFYFEKYFVFEKIQHRVAKISNDYSKDDRH